ncbi:MAG: hypothetical protein K0R34_3568 [Herbinix sp.]|jgi:hypothetical protein|nr:hypothetical protein [Herbinix sp.]
MRKILTILLIIVLSLPTFNYVKTAEATTQTRKLIDSAYTIDGKIKINSTRSDLDSKVFECTLMLLEQTIPKQSFMGLDGTIVEGVMTYPNIGDAKEGIFNLQWVFTPTQSEIYETKSGTLHFEIDMVKDEPNPFEIDEITIPSLTATTVLLASRTAYDINLNNKVSGTSYKWTSSNDKVAKVNPKNGLVTAVSEGTATITCAMAFPDGSSQELNSFVSINYDDNATILSDTVLDLDTGDKYTLKVENAPAGAKYKFASSDKSIVTVGTTSGKVTTVSSGDAYITCTITADNQVIVLRCDVSVSE